MAQPIGIALALEGLNDLCKETKALHAAYTKALNRRNNEIRNLRAAGMTQASIAKVTGLNVTTIQYIVAKQYSLDV